MRARAARVSAESPGQRLPVPASSDEIARLGDTLNAMLARLELALSRERELLADASHEIRTPWPSSRPSSSSPPHPSAPGRSSGTRSSRPGRRPTASLNSPRTCSSSRARIRAGCPARASSPSHLGPVGRVGRFAADHVGLVAVVWLLVVVGLSIFAPRVETALSGAGWEASGSESVRARQLVDKNFRGLSSSALQVVLHARDKTVQDPAFRRALLRRAPCSSSPRVATHGASPPSARPTAASPRSSPLLGHRAWWLPAPLARVLPEVHFGHA